MAYASTAPIEDRDLTAPPGGAAHLSSYLVAASATGDWSGEDGNYARKRESSWHFTTPQAGDLIYVKDEDTWIRYDGTTWVTDLGQRQTVTKTADYTALTSDRTIEVTTSTTDRTITLFAVAGNTGRTLDIKKMDSASGKVIIDGNSSETIDGLTTRNLVAQYENLTIKAGATEWEIQ